jgi:dihydrofolate reductase
MKPKIALIAAMAQNRTIGVNNTLPWRIPADLQHFKRMTLGHHILMGRKTFDSIGKPLPQRTTVVITRDLNLQLDGCLMAHSLEEAIAVCGEVDEIFVVGGGEIYTQALRYADTLYLTEVQQTVVGDAHFPELNQSEWQEISREICHQESPQTLSYHFVCYRRNN